MWPVLQTRQLIFLPSTKIKSFVIEIYYKQNVNTKTIPTSFQKSKGRTIWLLKSIFLIRNLSSRVETIFHSFALFQHWKRNSIPLRGHVICFTVFISFLCTPPLSKVHKYCVALSLYWSLALPAWYFDLPAVFSDVGLDFIQRQFLAAALAGRLHIPQQLLRKDVAAKA